MALLYHYESCSKQHYLWKKHKFQTIKCLLCFREYSEVGKETDGYATKYGVHQCDLMTEKKEIDTHHPTSSSSPALSFKLLSS